MPIYEYAWAIGTDVALMSLTNVETDLSPYTPSSLSIPAPKAQPPNFYPNRTVALDGTVVGDGLATLEWVFDALPVAAFQYIVTTYMTAGGSTAMTINTRLRDVGESTYGRYNCNLEYPLPGEDYIFENGLVIDVILRFRNVRLAS